MRRETAAMVMQRCIISSFKWSAQHYKRNPEPETRNLKPETDYCSLLTDLPTLDTRHSSLLRLAPDQRLGVTFQIICQDAERASGSGDLLQRVAQLLLGGSILTNEGRIGVF